MARCLDGSIDFLSSKRRNLRYGLHASDIVPGQPRREAIRLQSVASHTVRVATFSIESVASPIAKKVSVMVGTSLDPLEKTQ